MVTGERQVSLGSLSRSKSEAPKVKVVDLFWIMLQVVTFGFVRKEEGESINNKVCIKLKLALEDII